MASTSMLVRSFTQGSQRSLLSGACSCNARDASINFKGKNRAYLHAGRRANAEEQQQSTSTITTTQDAATAVEVDGIAIEGAEEPVAAEQPPSSSSSSEMSEVTERRRRMLLSAYISLPLP